MADKYRLKDDVWEMNTGSHLHPRVPGSQWVPLLSTSGGDEVEEWLREELRAVSIRIDDAGNPTDYQTADGKTISLVNPTESGSVADSTYVNDNGDVVIPKPLIWPPETEWPPMKDNPSGTGFVVDREFIDWLLDLLKSQQQQEDVMTQQEAIDKAEMLTSKLGEQYVAVHDSDTKLYTTERRGAIATTQPGLSEPEFFTGPDGRTYYRGTPDGHIQVLPALPQPVNATSFEALMIDLLSQADFNNPNDEFLLQAQAIQNFQNQPTPETRLDLALRLATSPADMQTLTRMLRGELPIQRGGPTDRLAPLNELLRKAAEDVFGSTAPTVPTETPAFAPPVYRPQVEEQDIYPLSSTPPASGGSMLTPEQLEDLMVGVGQGMAEEAQTGVVAPPNPFGGKLQTSVGKLQTSRSRAF